jgi:hypothetical protein
MDYPERHGASELRLARRTHPHAQGADRLKAADRRRPSWPARTALASGNVIITDCNLTVWQSFRSAKRERLASRCAKERRCAARLHAEGDGELLFSRAAS